MPNHFHGILWITPNTDLSQGAGLEHAPTKHTLSEIVRQFKTFSARKINNLRNTPGLTVWQRNYYEHIIRDERELDKIREYIVYNEAKWLQDQYYLR